MCNRAVFPNTATRWSRFIPVQMGYTSLPCTGRWARQWKGQWKGTDGECRLCACDLAVWLDTREERSTHPLQSRGNSGLWCSQHRADKHPPHPPPPPPVVLSICSGLSEERRGEGPESRRWWRRHQCVASLPLAWVQCGIRKKIWKRGKCPASVPCCGIPHFNFSLSNGLCYWTATA